MTFHLDNHSGNDIKNLWLEWDFIASSTSSSDVDIDTSVNPEPPAVVIDDATIDRVWSNCEALRAAGLRVCRG